MAMDVRNMALDDPNISDGARGVRNVPTFALYGEEEGTVLGHWLHCESIPARSSRNAWEIRPHRHRSYFQILYQNGGTGECVTEDARRRLKSPVAVTVPPGAVHGFRFSEDVQGWVITVVGERVLSVAETTPEVEGLLARPQVIELQGREETGAIDAAFALINSEFIGLRPARGALMEAQLRSIVILLARIAGPWADKAASTIHRRAAQLRRLLEDHYREQRSVDFYAKRLGVSQTHLNRICRTAFGKSALGLVHERVVLEASRDLAFTAMTVQDIGRSLGFDDCAYFSRLFKKAAGASPLAFRRRIAARKRPWSPTEGADGAETALAALSSSFSHGEKEGPARSAGG
jgi:AraC family transcriptional activator of pobA